MNDNGRLFRARRGAGVFAPLACVALAGTLAASCGAAGQDRAAADLKSPQASAAKVEGPVPTTPLSAPRTSAAQDARFFTQLAEADAALAPYVQDSGDVALRSLLTDGAAFCAFLTRDGGIDNAMTEVAIGARSVENKTHLPLSVRTFNAIDSVALVALCPSEQRLLPPATRMRVRQLEKDLAAK